MSYWDLSFAAHTRAAGPAGYGWCLCRTGEPNSLSMGRGVIPPPWSLDGTAAALVACGMALSAAAALRDKTPTPWPPVVVSSHHAVAVEMVQTASADDEGQLRLVTRCWELMTGRVGFCSFRVLESAELNSVASGEARRAVEGSVAA
jgi:hypothetical protein